MLRYGICLGGLNQINYYLKLNFMKKILLLTSFITISFLGVSCTSNKSVYQETTEVVTDNFASGYFDKHIKGNEYEVAYRGLDMNQKKVFDLSMLRAAEMTKQKGFKNFVVLSKVSESNKVGKQQIKTNTLKIAMYNDVPAKYGTSYNAADEYTRLVNKYKIK